MEKDVENAFCKLIDEFNKKAVLKNLLYIDGNQTYHKAFLNMVQSRYDIIPKQILIKNS